MQISVTEAFRQPIHLLLHSAVKIRYQDTEINFPIVLLDAERFVAFN